MANARSRFDAGNQRIFNTGTDEARASARDKQIDKPHSAHQLVCTVMGDVGKDLHTVRVESELGEPALHSADDGVAGTVSFFSAAQDADIAALETKCRSVRSDVRTAFVDDRNHAERYGDPADEKTVLARGFAERLSDRIGQCNEGADAVCHIVHTCIGQAQSVQHHGADLSFRICQIQCIFRKDLVLVCFDRVRHGGKRVVFFFGREGRDGRLQRRRCFQNFRRGHIIFLPQRAYRVLRRP